MAILDKAEGRKNITLDKSKVERCPNPNQQFDPILGKCVDIVSTPEDEIKDIKNIEEDDLTVDIDTLEEQDEIIEMDLDTSLRATKVVEKEDYKNKGEIFKREFKNTVGINYNDAAKYLNEERVKNKKAFEDLALIDVVSYNKMSDEERFNYLNKQKSPSMRSMINRAANNYNLQEQQLKEIEEEYDKTSKAIEEAQTLYWESAEGKRQEIENKTANQEFYVEVFQNKPEEVILELKGMADAGKISDDKLEELNNLNPNTYKEEILGYGTQRETGKRITAREFDNYLKETKAYERLVNQAKAWPDKYDLKKLNAAYLDGEVVDIDTLLKDKGGFPYTERVGQYISIWNKMNKLNPGVGNITYAVTTEDVSLESKDGINYIKTPEQAEQAENLKQTSSAFPTEMFLLNEDQFKSILTRLFFNLPSGWKHETSGLGSDYILITAPNSNSIEIPVGGTIIQKKLGLSGLFEDRDFEDIVKETRDKFIDFIISNSTTEEIKTITAAKEYQVEVLEKASNLSVKDGGFGLAKNEQLGVKVTFDNPIANLEASKGDESMSLEDKRLLVNSIIYDEVDRSGNIGKRIGPGNPVRKTFERKDVITSYKGNLSSLKKDYNVDYLLENPNEIFMKRTVTYDTPEGPKEVVEEITNQQQAEKLMVNLEIDAAINTLNIYKALAKAKIQERHFEKYLESHQNYSSLDKAQQGVIIWANIVKENTAEEKLKIITSDADIKNEEVDSYKNSVFDRPNSGYNLMKKFYADKNFEFEIGENEEYFLVPSTEEGVPDRKVPTWVMHRYNTEINQIQLLSMKAQEADNKVVKILDEGLSEELFDTGVLSMYAGKNYNDLQALGDKAWRSLVNLFVKGLYMSMEAGGNNAMLRNMGISTVDDVVLGWDSFSQGQDELYATPLEWEEVDSVLSFGSYAGNVFANNWAPLAMSAFTFGVSNSMVLATAIPSLSSGGDRVAEIVRENVDKGIPIQNYDNTYIWAQGLIFTATEMGPEMLFGGRFIRQLGGKFKKGTKLNRDYSTGFKGVMTNIAQKTLKTGQNQVLEGIGEGFTQMGQNIAVGDPMFKDVDKAVRDALILTTGVSMASSSPSLAAVFSKPFTSEQEANSIKELTLNVQENAKTIAQLQQLKEQNKNNKLINENTRTEVNDNIDQDIKLVEEQIAQNLGNLQTVQENVKTKIVAKGMKKKAAELYTGLYDGIVSIKIKADEIQNNDQLSKKEKKQQIGELREQYDEALATMNTFTNKAFFGHGFFALKGNAILNLLDSSKRKEYNEIIQIAEERLIVKDEKTNNPIRKYSKEEKEIEAMRVYDEMQFEEQEEIIDEETKKLGWKYESYDTESIGRVKIKQIYKDAIANEQNPETKKLLEEELQTLSLKPKGSINGFSSDLLQTEFTFKDVSIDNQRSKTRLHELFHRVSRTIIAQNPNKFDAFANEILSYLETTNPKVLERMKLENANLIKDGVVNNEELISSFVEEVSDNNIKLNAADVRVLYMGELFNQGLKDSGSVDMDFGGGLNVANFFKGMGERSQSPAFKEQLAEYKTKIEEATAKIDTKVAEEIKTEKPEATLALSENIVTETPGEKSKRQDKRNIDVAKIYDQQAEGKTKAEWNEFLDSPRGSNIMGDLVQQYYPDMVATAIKQKAESPIDVASEAMIPLMQHIRAFDPIKNDDLAGYIGGYLGLKVGTGAKRVAKKTPTLSMEQEGVKQVAERAVQVADTDSFDTDTDVIETKQPTNIRRALDIKEGSEIYNKVKDIVKKTFGTKLPSPTDPKFKKVVQDAFASELMSSVKELMGKPGSDKYKTFLQEYGEQIYDLIPQDVLNKSFEEFIIKGEENIGPLKVDKAIKEGLLPKDTPRDSGPTLFTRKKFDQQEWSDYHLAPTKGRPASKQTQLAQTISKELGKDAVLEVLEDPKVFERFGEVQELQGKKVTAKTKAKIAEKIGREPGIKFSESKPTKPQQRKIDAETKLFNADPGTQILAEQKTFEEIPKLYGAQPINLNTQKGKDELKARIFEGTDTVPPFMTLIPESALSAGTLSNGGLNENLESTEGYLEPEVINEMRISGLFEKVNAKTPVREYTLIDGSKIRNDNPAFISEEIQLKIAPVGKFLFANKLQIDNAIAEAKAQGYNFAPANPKIELAVKRQGYTAKLLKEMKNNPDLFFEKQNDKREGLKDLMLIFNEAVQFNMMEYLPVVTGLLSATSGSQNHLGRTGSIVEFYNTLDLKNVEEHTEPASDLMKFFLNRMAQGNLNEYIDPALDSFFQGQLPVVFDSMLKGVDDSGNRFNYQNNVPAEYVADVLLGLKPVWIRYFNPQVNSQVRTDPKTKKKFKGIDPNVIILSNGNSIAKEYGLEVDKKDLSPEVIEQQQKLLFKIFNDNVTQAEATKELNDYIKSLAKNKRKSAIVNAKNTNKSGVVNLSQTLPNSEILREAGIMDKALNIARDPNAPTKKIRVFDFDDTLAQTKSNVLYTMPDGKTGKLTAEQFAERGTEMLEQGAEFDFSEFNKVMEGKKGPLFKVAKKIQDVRGTEDVFILTARSMAATPAIKEFLDTVGLNIPLENITGLGDSSPLAKSGWVVGKAAEGYNDFYFADDAIKNVKAVKKVLDVIDVKSKVQQAKIKFSENVDKDFNKIIEQKTGVDWYKEYSSARAQTEGAGKGKFKFLIPPSAEDFTGLLYRFLGKGKVGDAQMAWFKQNLLNPYARGMNDLSTDRVTMMNDFNVLKKELVKSKSIPKNLNKKAIGNFTYQDVARVMAWDQQGIEVADLSKRDIEEFRSFIEKDSGLQVFVDQLIAINKGDGYTYPGKNWLAGNITTDLVEGLNTNKRDKYLEQWRENVDLIFSEKNLNKIEALFGSRYREALEDSLRRMKSGKNRTSTGSRLENRLLDYVNNSVGTVMFLNMRSGVLQTISSINFLNWKDNNPLQAGKAFANQKQYWSDFMTLMNSDFLVDRRKGLKINVSESEIADAARDEKNKARAVVNYLLKKGFTVTQIMDSFAIASGGATFYRNRIKSLIKDGMTKEEAEAQAFQDFRETAEESQQSARPDKISQQQASGLGRVVLAFANTPMQYNRIIKKATLDLVNGRGDYKTNLSKIVYYGMIQNIIFTALQQAIFAMAFSDEEDEEEKKKYYKLGNSMLDNLLRGIGVGGQAVLTVKNLGMDVYNRYEKSVAPDASYYDKKTDYADAAWRLLDFSPPISIKARKLRQAATNWEYNNWKHDKDPWSLDDPAWLSGSYVVSALTNIPLDRLVKKMDNVRGAMESDQEWWKRVAMLSGWSQWELESASDKEKRREKEKKQKSELKKEQTFKSRPGFDRKSSFSRKKSFER